MRHPVSTIIPPGGTITIEIKPPMTEHERPMILAVHGKDSVTILKNEPDIVILTNPTDKISPALFLVVKTTGMLPRLLNLANFFKG